MEKIEIFEGFWTEETVRQNPDKIFIFGDNDLRVGKGGQAIIRDLPNTFGIRTKKKPNLHPLSFYNDHEYLDNCQKIRQDVIKITELVEGGKTIVLSSGGYGTGLSKLPEVAPKTFEYLNSLLKFNFNFDNVSGKKWIRIPSHYEIINSRLVKTNNMAENWFESEENFKIGELVKFQTDSGFNIKQVTLDFEKKIYFKNICQTNSDGNIKYDNFTFGTFNFFDI
jgi:hypothetical protein